MRTHARSRRQTTYRATFALLALGAIGGSAAGCGGDGQASDSFAGLWLKELEPAASGFGLVCSDPNFADYNIPSLLIWGSVEFERGVATDLVEVSGNCPTLNWDINGKAAIVPDPDPVIAEAPACGFEISWQDATGFLLPGLVIISPQPDNWEFRLLGTKNAAGAPLAELNGAADVDILLLDETGSTIVSRPSPPCSYAGSDRFFRLTQP
jgi:hypothetical protein